MARDFHDPINHMRDPDYYRSRKNGLLYFRIPMPGKTRKKGVCTGQKSMHEARGIIEDQGVDRLQKIAQAKLLTAEAISIVTSGRIRICKDIIEAWIKWLPLMTSPRTAEAYVFYVRGMIKKLGFQDKPFAAIDENIVDRLVNDGNSSLPVSIMRMSALKSIFRFANAKGYIAGNPANLVAVRRRDMKLRQLEPRDKAPITEEEYQRIIASPAGVKRDWAIIGYCCGMRISDTICLEWDSFTNDHIIFYPKKSRSGKRLALPLNDPLIARPELKELTARIMANRDNGSDYVWPEHQAVFQTKARNRYSQGYQRLFESLGIFGKTFHSLRRGFIVRLNAANRPLESIAKIVGHTKTDTTRIYLDDGTRVYFRDPEAIARALDSALE